MLGAIAGDIIGSRFEFDNHLRLRSYKAAMKVIGNEARQETGRWLNNRAENSYQPFRR